jgi:hypothetical protein
MAMMIPELSFRLSMSVPAFDIAQPIGGDLNRVLRRCGATLLRGRKAVRADRRLHADEKHIRVQSTILNENKPKPPLLSSIARPLATTKARTLLSLEGSNFAAFQLPVDNIRAFEANVAE